MDRMMTRTSTIIVALLLAGVKAVAAHGGCSSGAEVEETSADAMCSMIPPDIATAPISSSLSPTLHRIRSRLDGRGQLVCAHVDFTLGHSKVDSPSIASGMEPELCIGLAAALGLDAKHDGVRFHAMMQPAERFPLLQSGAVDVVFALTSKTLARDMREYGSFSIPYFQDQHNLMIRSDAGIIGPASLGGKTICATAGTTNPNVLNDYLASIEVELGGNKNVVNVKLVDDDTTALALLRSNECQAFVNDDSVVAGYIHSESAPSAGVIYSLANWQGTPFARAPFSAVTLDGDAEWASIVDWFINSLFLAEMYGITSENAETMYRDTTIPGEAQRLLGSQLIGGIPLSFDMKAAIKTIGNYAQLYERNFGAFLPRSRANQLYQNGGVVFPGGFR